MKHKLIQPTSVRIPDELKGWVKERATENMRSMSAEINLLLMAVKGQIERKEKQETV